MRDIWRNLCSTASGLPREDRCEQRAQDGGQDIWLQTNTLEVSKGDEREGIAKVWCLKAEYGKLKWPPSLKCRCEVEKD